MSQPNVLLIICDDLNNAIAGMGRSPAAACPNLQRLMQKGVRFTNAHSNCPICMPSRNSLLSGLYPYTTGHYQLWDNQQTCLHINNTMERSRYADIPLLRDAVMLPKYFKDNGYGVYGAGKVFHQGAYNPTWWTEFAYGTDYGPYLWDSEAKRPRLRDDRLFLCEGNALADYVRRYEGVDRFWLDGKRFRHAIELAFGPLEDALPRGSDIRNGDGSSYHYVSDMQRDPLPDEKTAAWIAAKLKERHTAPFFLAAGFMKPHSPLNVPQKYFDLFPLDTLQIPPILEGDMEDCARALIDHRPFGFLMYRMMHEGGGRLLKEWVQAYLACIAFMDDQVGVILDALEQSPYLDNTIVVFTSDNGYHMGEKEYIFKDSLWEEGGQVPLIVAAPGISTKDRACRKAVSLVDIYPMLVDLCGLPPEPHASTHSCPLAGHSLRALLEDPEREIWGGAPVALVSVRGDTGVHHSVRSERYRYTLCSNGEEELYDHQTDPHEWRNLIGVSEYESIRIWMRQELMKLLEKALRP